MVAPPRVDDLLRRLLIQCPPERADTVAPIAARYRSGLVLTGPKPRAMVRHLRRTGYAGPILCDASRYTGRQRLRADAGLRASWTEEQHELGLVALTDSGYLAAGDWPGLHRLLEDAARQRGPLLVTLPLDAGWFAVRAWVDRLIVTLDRARLPVAVTVIGESFGTRYVTRGLVRLLSATVPILLLRSGTGAIGALSHGAHAGALATSSGLFVSALLGHHRQSVLARIADRTPDLARLWPCHCPECRGALPVRLGPDAIYRHSLHTQLTLAGELCHLRHDVPNMIRTWRQLCANALAVHQEVARAMPPWAIPAALRWWYEVEPPPVAGLVPLQNVPAEICAEAWGGDRRTR